MLELGNHAYPCKNCETRAVGCHGSCKRYILMKEWAEKEKHMAKEDNRQKDYTRPIHHTCYSAIKLKERYG